MDTYTLAMIVSSVGMLAFFSVVIFIAFKIKLDDDKSCKARKA